MEATAVEIHKLWMHAERFKGTWQSEITLKVIKELQRRREGKLTPAEFQLLCHNLPEGCDRETFEEGCKEYQNMLFGPKQTQDYQELYERLEREIQAMEYLVAEDVVFLSYQENRVEMVINCNDLFVTAADGETLAREEVLRFKEFYLKWHMDAVTAWVGHKRGMEPMMELRGPGYKAALKELQDASGVVSSS